MAGTWHSMKLFTAGAAAGFQALRQRMWAARTRSFSAVVLCSVHRSYF
jgi:hypothetical protein